MVEVEPDTVIFAWSPTAAWPTWALLTVVSTTYEPVATTTTCAVVELEADEDEPPVDALPDPAPPPVVELEPGEEPEPVDPAEELELPFDPEEELDPATCWPTVRSTEATVPAMVEVKVASDSAVCALATWVWADATVAWSEAIWAADALPLSSLDN